MTMHKDEVIFGGFDEPVGGNTAFGIFVPVDLDVAMWLPATTASPIVAETLKGLRLGQVFKITSEEVDGPMGTRVNAVEVPADARVYDLPNVKSGYVYL